jgi:hypothetical protein
MKEAARNVIAALEKMKNCGAQTILDGTSKSKAEQLMSDEQLEAYQEFMAAQAYRAFVIKRRDSKYITNTLKESHPMLEISPVISMRIALPSTPRKPHMTCAKGWLVRGSILRKISSPRSPQ